jgi:hypothetical protein
MCPSEKHLQHVWKVNWKKNPTKTIAQQDVCPERHLPRKKITQKKFCFDDICPERPLPKKTIAEMTFDQKDICSEILLLTR